MHFSRYAISVCLVFSIGCATTKKAGGDVDTLKPSLERFHEKIRWRDFRSAAALMVPEKRGPFLKARTAMRDDKDLSITDYELDDLVVSGDGSKAVCTSRLSWFRLPSATEHTDTVVSIFVWKDGQWLLESQSEGPFAEELKATVAPPPDPTPTSP